MNNTSKVKQVIVVRKDLGMSSRKTAAQVAHASLKVFVDRMSRFTLDREDSQYIDGYIFSATDEMKKWLDEGFTKVVVSCDSEDEIYDLAKKAQCLKIPYAIIVDSGFTEFAGNRTTTCIAIGPDDAKKIDKLTKSYKLL